jgi:tRNA threonylcarbamoyladenosine biosynthesis protein TsaB
MPASEPTANTATAHLAPAAQEPAAYEPAAPAPVSLAEVVAAHGSVLVLDPCTIHVQAGLLRAGHAPLWHTGGDDSSVHLFDSVQTCLAAAGLKPGQVGAYVFCDGPGSQLGIRTAAMALRTWQALRTAPAPVFTYRSLLLAALTLARRQPGPFAVVADARRDSWHAVRIASCGTASPVLRASRAELADWPEPLFTPAGFRAWAQPPRPAGTCAYDCAEMSAALGSLPLLTAVAEPEPWLSAPITYQTWTGQRHRAAT